MVTAITMQRERDGIDTREVLDGVTVWIPADLCAECERQYEEDMDRQLRASEGCVT